MTVNISLSACTYTRVFRPLLLSYRTLHVDPFVKLPRIGHAFFVRKTETASNFIAILSRLLYRTRRPGDIFLILRGRNKVIDEKSIANYRSKHVKLAVPGSGPGRRRNLDRGISRGRRRCRESRALLRLVGLDNV